MRTVEEAIALHIKEKYNNIIVDFSITGIHIFMNLFDPNVKKVQIVHIIISNTSVFITTRSSRILEYVYDLCDPDSLIKIEKIIEETIYKHEHYSMKMIEEAIALYIKEKCDNLGFFIDHRDNCIYVYAERLDNYIGNVLVYCLIYIKIDDLKICVSITNIIKTENPCILDNVYDLCDPDSLTKIEKIIEDTISQYKYSKNIMAFHRYQ